MKNYQNETYGEYIAAIYDKWYAEADDAMIETLAELAQCGQALELGIGTGRIALPLQLKGVTVHGIDASPAMIQKLREKPDSEKLQVTLGDFADIPVENEYDLIYVVFNTFYALLSQEEQIHCMNNVAKRLGPTGKFAVEAFVPDIGRFTDEQSLRVVDINDDEVRMDLSTIDSVAQHITSQHVTLGKDGIQLYPVKLRYVWPSEMDLMARLSGLQLKHRWGDWHKSAFTAVCGKHVSVYEHMH